MAGLLNLAAFVPYVLGIFGWGIGRNGPVLHRITPTKPNRATWFIWTFVGSVILPSYHYSGADETIWVPAALTAGPFAVALLSLKWGEGGWTRFDQVCLAGACISVGGWAITGSPVVGLLLALVADGFGAVATIRHAYRRPEEENRLAWILFLVGDLANLLAVTDWSLAALTVWSLPVYMVLQTIPIAVLSARKGGAR
ncbi:hypothetical protein A3A39_03590 [Candidatus Kaiserbacteria bacterium RIFCSPLOWO2_01_FULL_54_13]|uniref:Uncharacterized protein n=1 Tax=Candidatus Kaiserbacteria bacterium RIFCSPLOWO2_01_FULL_54_13 TaxID=1798512 RepID=A0A1F6EZY2_9BACT|nr:MAG: hypothetical protein A3A39_03590 [Candidatus Kaiserbacteria bacterium RIFCSPLOWO2_01_FULL_54_13]